MGGAGRSGAADGLAVETALVGASAGHRAMVFVVREDGTTYSRSFDGLAWANLQAVDFGPVGPLQVQAGGSSTIPSPRIFGFAMGAAGVAAAVRSELSGEGTAVRAARWDGSWSLPETLAAHGFATWFFLARRVEASIAVAQDGAVTAAWSFADLDGDPISPFRPNRHIETRTFTNGSWGPATTFADAAGPRLAEGGGKSLLTFTRLVDRAAAQPGAAVGTAGSWSAATTLTKGLADYDVLGSMAADGTGWVTYARVAPGREEDRGSSAVCASRYDGTSFQKSVQASAKGTYSSGGRIAAGPGSVAALLGVRTVFAEEDDPADPLFVTSFHPVSPSGPQIGKIAAKSGLTAGAALTVVGSNFGASPGTLTLGATPLAVLSWTSSRVCATVPAGSGDATLVLRRADGGQVFFYVSYDGPVVGRVTRGKPRSDGTVQLTVRGAGFGLIAADPLAAILIGEAVYGPGDTSILSWTNTVVKLRLPQSAVSGQMRVRTSAGETQPIDLP
jgi:hypothetical protein